MDLFRERRNLIDQSNVWIFKAAMQWNFSLNFHNEIGNRKKIEENFFWNRRRFSRIKCFGQKVRAVRAMLNRWVRKIDSRCWYWFDSISFVFVFHELIENISCFDQIRRRSSLFKNKSTNIFISEKKNRFNQSMTNLLAEPSNHVIHQLLDDIKENIIQINDQCRQSKDFFSKISFIVFSWCFLYDCA